MANQFQTRLVAAAILAALLLLLQSCGGAAQGLGAAKGPDAQPLGSAGGGWPTALPQDAAQPWEGGAKRESASINGSSEFTPGIERFLEGAGSGASVTAQGEASRLDSGSAGAGETAWAIYRLPLGGGQPGALSFDVNYRPHDGGSAETSGYFVGLSDYGLQRWVWHGPFHGNNNVRLAGALLPADDYSSSAGNMFVCVLAHDGSALDVVGIGHNLRDSTDATAPPAPTGLSAAAFAGGIELQWNSVIAADLAGYQLYYSSSSISDVHAAGVRRANSLEGLTRGILSTGSGSYSVAVSAVDTSGNESAPAVLDSQTVSGAPPSPVSIEVSTPSALRGESVMLSLNGSGSYDLDLDGDGLFELTGESAGSFALDTSAPGLLRVNVRQESGGSSVAHGGVSVLVFANSRPACSAVASPSSGDAPLEVSLSGEAQDSEDEAGELNFAWDFDGDGIFESGNNTLTPAPQHYLEPGFFNARLRVTDSEGAWSVASAGILVTGSAPNEPPDGFMGTDVPGGEVPITVHFNTDNVEDEDGTIVRYDWDFNGDGIWEAYDGPAELDWTFTQPGSPDILLRVTDDDGASSIIFDNLSFTAPGNNPPVANLTPVTQSGNVPLSVNFNASGSTAGGDTGDSIVLYEWDFDGNGNWDGYGEDPTITHVYNGPGAFTARLRVTDEMGNQHIDTSAITASVAGNNPPVASLLPATATGPAPLTVNFDASGSSAGGDTGDSIVLYEWDWDGNGNWDGYGEDPTISFTFNLSGIHVVRLRVTDEAGNQSTATSDIDVLFSPITIDDSGNTGAYSSMAIVNGYPAISYFDGDNIRLKYVRATDASGSSWGSPVIAGAAGGPGQFNSLNVVDGNPAISTYLASGQDLGYVRANDANGQTWPGMITVDSGGANDVGRHSSLQIVGGHPAIAYYDFTDGDLEFIRSTSTDGSSWPPMSITLDSDGTTGSETSMAIVSGHAAISYFDASENSLKYIRATASDASTWGAVLTLDNTGGFYTSLAIINGFPAVAYRAGSADLHYLISNDAFGLSWPSPVIIDSSGDTGSFASLALIAGGPAVAYHSTSESSLRFSEGVDSSGLTWKSPVTIDDSGFTGEHACLRSVAGLSAVSYYSQSAGALMYARFAY